MLSSIDVISSWMAPRSNGVYEVRHGDEHRRQHHRRPARDPSLPGNGAGIDHRPRAWRAGPGAASTASECSAKSSKKRSSGINARNQPSMKPLASSNPGARCKSASRAPRKAPQHITSQAEIERRGRTAQFSTTARMLRRESYAAELFMAGLQSHSRHLHHR